VEDVVGIEVGICSFGEDPGSTSNLSIDHRVSDSYNKIIVNKNLLDF